MTMSLSNDDIVIDMTKIQSLQQCSDFTHTMEHCCNDCCYDVDNDNYDDDKDDKYNNDEHADYW